MGRASFVLCCVMVAGCRQPSSTEPQPGEAHEASAGVSSEWFSERAQESRLDFVHFNGMSGKFYQPEIMAPGVALFDYDNDGDLDVYLVQGRMLGNGEPLIKPPANGLEDRLYRNDLQIRPDGSRVLRFTDVTAASGIKTRGYGMGVAVGDIDNDGWLDLYVTGFGRNQLFRNNGNGTFADISSQSGTDDPESWGVSATFADFDRDGRLDLFVGNYLNYRLESHVACFGASGAPDYCRPSVYQPRPSRLYRNEGGGHFTDVTIASGVAKQFGPALGAIAADFNGDSWLDLFVANDEHENQLWINNHNFTFTNVALLSGVALGPNGERKANMGVDAADFDNDGDDDLVVTELINQGTSLFVNNGKGVFEEQSTARGIHRASLPYTGFGTAWFDYDNDGWLDLVAVNGDVNQNVKDLARKDNPFPLGQRNQLFHNLNGRFEDVTDRAGRAFQPVEASRGAAVGDIDNDGDLDLVVANGAGPVRLLINNVGSNRHWLGVRLVSKSAGGRDMVGARVNVVRRSAPALWRRARADGSYASSHDPRVLVGLGDSTERPLVRVVWPDGRAEEWADVPIDRYTTLEAGTGRR